MENLLERLSKGIVLGAEGYLFEMEQRGYLQAGAVNGYMAVQPVPYRTTDEQPSFMALKEPGRPCAFPLGLDPFTHTRQEMADFAVKAAEIGINYIGICCGAAPHHVGAMAESLGRTVPSSRYSPDMSLHPVLGKENPNCRDDE